MVKFKGKNEAGEKIFGFGLSFENIDRLKMGHPIRIDLKDLGEEEGVMVIFSGRNEEEIAKKLAPWVTADGGNA